MTWAHYIAELEDINGRKASAVIDCDKYTPNMIGGSLSYIDDKGIAERPVWSGLKHKDKKGEQTLLNNIKSEARVRGLRFITEEFTEFSKLKPKE